MNILILQLSDVHIATREDGFAVNIDKIVQALNYFPDVEQCIIILSGDITQSGNMNEFRVAGAMLGSLVNKLKEKKFKDKYIKIVVVPGNHDLDLTSNKRTFETIIQAYKNKKAKDLIDCDLVQHSANKV